MKAKALVIHIHLYALRINPERQSDEALLMGNEKLLEFLALVPVVTEVGTKIEPAVSEPGLRLGNVAAAATRQAADSALRKTTI